MSNAGLVQLAGTGVGNKLTVGSYAGQGGRINLNTVLGGDASPTDQLVIDGGSASGQTSLQVTNVGGLGAATPGNGILLVNAVNGATSEASAFSLGNSLEAGPYRYSLYRGSRDDSAPDSWFLRSQREDDSATPPPTGGPVTPTTPDYRPETSLYAAIPSLGLTYAQAMVDSLHERVGEENRSLEGTLQQRPAGDGPLGWGRMIYRSGQQDRDETVVGHRPFLVIADHLTRRGVAVLRCDDRGAGASTGSFNAATLEDFAADAAAAFEVLRARPDIRGDAVGLIGEQRFMHATPVGKVSDQFQFW